MRAEVTPSPGSHQVLGGISHFVFPFPDPESQSVDCVLFQLQVLQRHAFKSLHNPGGEKYNGADDYEHAYDYSASYEDVE